MYCLCPRGLKFSVVTPNMTHSPGRHSLQAIGRKKVHLCLCIADAKGVSVPLYAYGQGQMYFTCGLNDTYSSLNLCLFLNWIFVLCWT